MTSQGSPLAGRQAGSCQTPRRARRPTTKLGITQIGARAAGLPAPTERPASELPFPGSPGAGGNPGGAQRLGREAPAKFPPEQAARGVRCVGGAGRRGREPRGRTRRGCAPRGCFGATRAGQLAAASQGSSGKAPPSQPAAARLPSRPQRRGPGTRTPERKGDAPAAAPHLPRWLARASGSQPGRSRCVHGAARTHSTWPNSKAPGTEEGARGGSAAGEPRSEGRGENCKCYNFLPCPPPGSGGLATRRGEGSARSANEFTFFSPPRSPPLPSRRPLHLLRRCRGRTRVLGSQLGSRRMEKAREEGEGEVRRRAGAVPRSSVQDLNCVAGDAPGRVCPSPGAYTCPCV